MKLYNLAKELIIEAANKETIKSVIDGKHLVEVSYDDEQDPGGTGKRWIEVVAYGTSLADNDVVRAYQVGGKSKTGEIDPNLLPGWRLFKVNNFLYFKKLSHTFDTVRDNFNPNGDKSMKVVHRMINFNK